MCIITGGAKKYVICPRRLRKRHDRKTLMMQTAAYKGKALILAEE
jgi:hypothetical protein